MIKKICTTHAMTHASGAGSASDVDEKSTTDRHAKIPPAEDTWQPAHTSGESDSLELQVDTGTRVAAAAVMSGAALEPRMDTEPTHPALEVAANIAAAAAATAAVVPAAEGTAAGVSGGAGSGATGFFV